MVAATEEQQSALGSLAEVVLQNRRALNVITAETGGVHALLNETCCFYFNTSGQVEEDLQILKKKIKLTEDLKERAEQSPRWLSSLLSSMGIQIWTWLFPLLGPLILLAFVLLFGPCILTHYLNSSPKRFKRFNCRWCYNKDTSQLAHGLRWNKPPYHSAGSHLPP